MATTAALPAMPSVSIATAVSHKVTVAAMPPRATAETIAGALSPSSSMQLACAPECVFHDHTKSHWRLSYSGAGGDSLLPVTLAMKIGEIQASEGRRGNGDWRLGEATTGHARRVLFVSAVNRTQHPAFVDRDSLNSVLVERAEGLAEVSLFATEGVE